MRLVGDNVEQGIYSYEEAMRIADVQNLDLVEISATADPPVCRIIDYQKFLYQKKRKEKEQKQNSKKVEIKEIRFGPQTDEHDYNFKLKHAREFLADGNKVKSYVFGASSSKSRANCCWRASATTLRKSANPKPCPNLRENA